MRSAPTLKIWITPFASVAMLEKLALFKIAFCSAPAVSTASCRLPSVMTSVPPPVSAAAELGLFLGMAFLERPNPFLCKFQRCVHGVHELTDLDGLGEIAEVPCLQALLDVVGH